MKRFLGFFLFLFFYNTLSSQGRIEGRVLDKDSGSGVPHIIVTLMSPTIERHVETDNDGNFAFDNISTGTYTLVVREAGYFESSTDIDYVRGETAFVQNLEIERNITQNANLNDIPVVEQSDDESSNVSNNTVASLLNSSRDIFAFNAFMGLGQGGFRPRGLNGQDQTMYINGIPMENILRGNMLNFNDYVGLNDILRSRSSYYGIKAIPFAFGELTNNIDADAEAIHQRKGLRVSQWLTNRNFQSRTTITYATGLLKNDIAIAGSFSFRGASEGYIPGTSMETFSGYLSFSKKWSQKLVTSLTGIMANNKRAVSKAVTKEFYSLAGTNYYNPNWGFQNGQKRSASIRSDNVPMVIFSADYKPKEGLNLSFSGALQTGKRYAERLDWYNSYSPDPTYYRNAPSFYLDNPPVYQDMLQDIQNDKDILQINWKRLYDANQGNIETVPEKNITGKWARYLMYRDVAKVTNISFNSVAKYQMNDKIGLFGGLMIQSNQNQIYKEATDLLGADFFVNINQFAQRANPSNPNAIHNDLNNPYGIVKVGDKYGYNAISKATNISAWAQSLITLNQIDGFLALRVENTSYSREGLYKNGAYETNSFGASPSKSFMNFSIKGGLTYKLNGKNYFSANAMRISQSPQYEQVFVLPRTTNYIADNVKPNVLTGGEFTYNHRGARTKITLNAFYTQSVNENDVRIFYTELTNSFGSLIMTDMNKTYKGIEIAGETKVGSTGFTVLALASIGDYIYSSRPQATFYYDNFNKIEPSQTVYFQNLKLATGPQNAGMIKISYSSKQFWNASLNLNYFDKIYADPSPQRRTSEAVDNIDPSSDLYSRILTQERFPSAFTLDAYFRKSFMLNKYIKSLKKRMYFDISLNLNNILNYQNFITSGREQLRFDFRDNNPDKFPNRYFYMMGRTYSLQIVFRM